MKLDENLAAVHAYLCADGYVLKTEGKKHKQYGIGFRNTNLTLLKDFQYRFKNSFGVVPHLDVGERCRIGNKKIHQELIQNFGSFHSWEWRMPKLKNKLLRIWLRVYFDCEGWVFCKSHQNRHIGVDCVNKGGLDQVERVLNRIGITTIRKFNKKRDIHRLFIYGKDNLLLFKNQIGFLHPDKFERLNIAINNYVEYVWQFPKGDKECRKFVLSLLKDKIRIHKPYYIRIFSREEINLKNLHKSLKKFYNIDSIVNKQVNGIGTIYYEMNINRKSEVEKLIKLKALPNLFKLN